MENNTKQARFQFLSYLIDQVSINFTGKQLSKEMEFAINPEGKFNQEEKKFELIMSVIVNDKEHNMDLNMRIRGFFSYDGDDMGELKSFIGINSPAILFPYIRSYVTNITALGGLSPVIMPTLNMKGVGEKLVQSLNL